MLIHLSTNNPAFPLLTDPIDPKARPPTDPENARRRVFQPDDRIVAQAKNENAPSFLEAFFKRGGRDSNPQPPDRQSGTLTN